MIYISKKALATTALFAVLVPSLIFHLIASQLKSPHAGKMNLCIRIMFVDGDYNRLLNIRQYINILSAYIYFNTHLTKQ